MNSKSSYTRFAVKQNFRPYIRRYTFPNEKFEYSYPLILLFWWIAAVNCLIILNCISVYIDDHYALLSYEMTTTYRVLYVCKLPHTLNIVHVRQNKENNILFLWLKLYYKCKAYKCFNRKNKTSKNRFYCLRKWPAKACIHKLKIRFTFKIVGICMCKV